MLVKKFAFFYGSAILFLSILSFLTPSPRSYQYSTSLLKFYHTITEHVFVKDVFFFYSEFFHNAYVCPAFLLFSF